MDFSLRASLFHEMFLENLGVLDSAAAHMRIKPKIIGLIKAADFLMQMEARIAGQSWGALGSILDFFFFPSDIPARNPAGSKECL